MPDLPKEGDTKVEVIERLKWDGKYVEFWWVKDDPDPACQYDESEKQYRLHEAVTAADLDEHVANHGYRGLRVQWEFRSPNWYIKAVVGTKTLTAQQLFNVAWSEFCRDESDGYPYYDAKPHKSLGDLQDLAAKFYGAGFIDGYSSDT